MKIRREHPASSLQVGRWRSLARLKQRIPKIPVLNRLGAVARRAQRLQIAARVVAANRVLFDVVHLVRRVQTALARGAPPLLLGRHFLFFRFCQPSARIVHAAKLHPLRARDLYAHRRVCIGSLY